MPKLFDQHYVVLALTYFCYFGYFGVTVPFLGVFLDGRGLGSVEIGELMAIITFVRILGPNIWATLADKSGKTLLIMRLGCFLTLCSYLWLFYFKSFWGIGLALALVMTFWTAIIPQLENITLSRVDGDAKRYSQIRSWGSIGFIATSIIAGMMVDRDGSESVLLVNTCILSGLFGMSLLVTDIRTKKAKTSQDKPIWNAIKQPVFILFMLSAILLQLSFAPYYVFFALYMRDLGYSGQEIGWLVSLGVAAEVIIFMVAGRLINRQGIKYSLVFCMLVTALRWGALAEFAHYPVVLFVSQCLHAFSFALAHAASVKFIHGHFGESQKNRGQAMYISVSFGVGGSLGSIVAGQLWQQGQGAFITFAMASGAALLGALLVAIANKKQMNKAL